MSGPDELGTSPERADVVYKVLRRREAAHLVAEGRFEGSDDDLRDGFVHLSTAGQVSGTLARHFAAESGLFLGIARVAALADALRWEPSRGGELFPHLYRALEVGDIAALSPIPDRRQEWRIPVLMQDRDAAMRRGN